MRVDISGSWIYVYTGTADPNGPFSKVQCIHAGTVTDLTFNQRMCSIQLGIGAREVRLEFMKRLEYTETKNKLVALFEMFGLTSGFVDVLEWVAPDLATYSLAESQVDMEAVD